MAIPILLYHQIVKPTSGRTPFRSMLVHPRAFRLQMKALKYLGFQGLSLREAMPYIQGKKKGKVVALTFDDSYASVFENALPVLEEVGFSATNFVVVNQINGYNKWDLELGVPPALCMTLPQLCHWTKLGHEVGSHTLDHVRLSEMKVEEAEQQIAQSRVDLENLIDDEVSSFCFPYGDETYEQRGLVHDAGYKVATTTERRRATRSDDPFGLPRLTVRRNDTVLHVLRKCLLD